MLHFLCFISCQQVVIKEQQFLVFTIPIFEPLPSQYYIRAVSDRWLGAEAVCIINFQHLILPERHPPHTGRDLLYKFFNYSMQAFLRTFTIDHFVFNYVNVLMRPVIV